MKSTYSTRRPQKGMSTYIREKELSPYWVQQLLSYVG